MKTKYHVIRSVDGGDAWELIAANVEATSQAAACREAADTLEDQEQAEMVAVPSRSWKVIQVETKLERTVRVGG